MKTNEQYLEEINGMLRNLADNRHGSFKCHVPEEVISDTLDCVHTFVNNMCQKTREKYLDSMEICPEYEKEYTEG